MRQGYLWWKQLNKLLRKSQYQFSELNSKQVRKFLTFMGGGLTFIVLWLWHWQLLLATITGIGLMLIVYWLQVSNWQNYFLPWLRLFSGQPRKLTIAVGSGGIAALMTYISASIWANSENRWLAVGSILQGVATMLTLGLLSWHFLSFKSRESQTNFEEILRDLTDVTPLKRLIAVRKFTKLVGEQYLSTIERQELLQYLRVMLSHESELIIQDAIWSALQLWDAQELDIPEQPLTISLQDAVPVNDLYSKY